MAQYTAISDDELFTQIVDYGNDYPKGVSRSHGKVSYTELKNGYVEFDDKKVPTIPLSSLVRAREIAETLKKWISKGNFFLGEPQFTLPGSHRGA
jgi:uncharacterized protein (DUF39 family)